MNIGEPETKASLGRPTKKTLTKKEYSQALFKFLLNEYGSPDFIIDVTESVVGFAQKLKPRDKRFQMGLNILKYATPAFVLTSELYSKVRRFQELLREPTEAYDERERRIRKLLDMSLNPEDRNLKGPDISSNRFNLGKEIATWIAGRPKTSRFKIRSFHAASANLDLLEDPFGAEAHDVLILLEYKEQKYVWEISFTSTALDIYIQDMWLYTKMCPDCGELIEKLEKEIYTEFIDQFDVSENVLVYSGALSTRPRHQFHEPINQFNLEGFEAEVYKVLRRKKKRGYAFVGVPGTGKSTIIRKMELHFRDYPIVYLSPDCFTIPDNVERTFDMLRLMQPCIVILEDLDSYNFKYKNDKLGVFLDRIDDVNRSINAVFIATINDTALVHYSLINRPGRLDQVIMIETPSTPMEVYEVLKIRFDKNRAVEDNIKGDFPPFEEVDESILKDIIAQRFTQADICEIVEKALLVEDSITNDSLRESVLSLMGSKRAIKACNFHEDNPYGDDEDSYPEDAEEDEPGVSKPLPAFTRKNKKSFVDRLNDESETVEARVQIVGLSLGDSQDCAPSTSG